MIRSTALGKRQQRIRLQVVDRMAGEGGRMVETVRDIATIWASVHTRGAGADVEADQRFLTNEVMVSTHFARRFQQARRIDIAGTGYDVLSVEDVDMAHKTLVFRAKPRPLT